MTGSLKSQFHTGPYVHTQTLAVLCVDAHHGVRATTCAGLTGAVGLVGGLHSGFPAESVSHEAGHTYRIALELRLASAAS